MAAKNPGFRVPQAWVPVLLGGCLLAACLEFEAGTYLPPALARAGSLFPPYWKVAGDLWGRYALAFLQTLLLSAAFWSSGASLLRKLGARPDNAWEEASWAFALGSICWAYLFFLLGLAGLLYGPLLKALLAAGGVFSLWTLATGAPEPRRFLQPFRGERSAGVAAALFLLQLLILLPYALVPETFYDSLEYHLGLPHLYLLRGTFGPTPDSSFSGVPAAADMLFGWGLVLDRWGGAAHLLNFTFLFWTFAALNGLAIRLRRPAAGPLAGFAFATMPVVGFTAYFTHVELPWCFYQTLCLSGLLAALSAPPGAEERRAGLWISGMLLGMTLSLKYLAWSAPAAFLLFAYGARGRKDAISTRESLQIAAVSGLLLLPWLVKNFAFYGNPLFPFLHRIFAPESSHLPGTAYLGEGAAFDFAARGFFGYVRDVLAAPWRMIHYQGIFGKAAGPVPAALLLVSLLESPGKKDGGWKRFLAGCWLPLAFVVHLPRFYIPASALACLAGCLVICGLRPPPRRAAVGLVAVAAALTAACAALWGVPRTRLPVFTGTVSREEFLSRSSREYYPAPLFSAGEWLRRRSGRDAKVLVFGDSRGFYLMRDHINSTPMQTTILERLANASASGRELKSRLDAEGVTHILVNHAEIVRQRMRLRFSPRGKRSLDEFWARYTLKVFQDGPMGIKTGKKVELDRWVVLYRLLGDEEASRPHPVDSLFETYAVD